MRDLYLLLINNTVSLFDLLLLAGLIRTIYHHKTIISKLIQKKITPQERWQETKPIMRSLSFIIGGTCLMFGTFALTNTLIQTIIPQEIALQAEKSTTTSFFLLDPKFLGINLAFLWIITAYLLILSIGHGWLLKLSKISSTFAFSYLFMIAFIVIQNSNT